MQPMKRTKKQPEQKKKIKQSSIELIDLEPEDELTSTDFTKRSLSITDLNSIRKAKFSIMSNPEPCCSSSLKPEPTKQALGFTESASPVAEESIDENDEQNYAREKVLGLSNVVSKIFDFVDLTSLKKCRQVCTLWNQEACRALQERWPITFLSGKKISEYTEIFQQADEVELPFPNSNFKFQNIEFSEENSVLCAFFSTFGHFVKTLNLLLVHSICKDKLRSVLLKEAVMIERLWIRTLPMDMTEPVMQFRPRMGRPGSRNMGPRHRRNYFVGYDQNDADSAMAYGLDFEFQPDHSSSTSPSPKCKNRRQSRQELFVSDYPTVTLVYGAEIEFSGLRELIIGNFDLKPPKKALPGTPAPTVVSRLQELYGIMPYLRKIVLATNDQEILPIHARLLINSIVQMPTGSLAYLSEIRCPILVNDEVLRGLANLRCRLLSDIDMIFYEPIKEDLLANVFKQSHDQNKLSLTFAASFNIPYRFGHSQLLGQNFPRLTELTLRRYSKPMNFLNMLPNLRKLFLKDVDVTRCFPINPKPMNNMRVFKIELESLAPYAIDSEVTCRMTRAFPALTDLVMTGATDECLRILFTDLPFLSNFECTQGEFTDSGITGVPLIVCNDMCETFAYTKTDGDTLRMNLYIGSLTRLKRLVLESAHLSLVTLLYGTKKCSNLQHLSITSPRITDHSLTKLLDNEHGAATLTSLDLSSCNVSPAALTTFAEGLKLKTEFRDEEKRREGRGSSSTQTKTKTLVEEEPEPRGLKVCTTLSNEAEQLEQSLVRATQPISNFRPLYDRQSFGEAAENVNIQAPVQVVDPQNQMPVVFDINLNNGDDDDDAGDDGNEANNANNGPPAQ